MRQKETANLFSVSVSTIKKWSAEGFPVKAELKEMIVWVRRNKPLVTSEITEARTRKINAEARLKELELMIKEKELIPRTEILQLFLDRIATVKSGLLSLHRILGPAIVGKDPREVSIIVKRAVINLLNKYSRRSGILRK
jgi:hypothetical protein